jgi:hypothetical protein
MAAVQITNYGELLAAGADWLNRADLVDQMPAFVTLTTAQFNRELRTRDMMTRAEATSSDEFVNLPVDWLEHYSLQLASDVSGWPLRYISEKESNAIKASLQNQGGSPAVVAYTIIGNTIELVPAPGGDVDLKMVYFAKIPDFTDSASTNWLLTKSPDFYLYSVLLQAAPYLKDDNRLSVWVQLRSAIGETIRLESEASLRPRSQLSARAPTFY